MGAEQSIQTGERPSEARVQIAADLSPPIAAAAAAPRKKNELHVFVIDRSGSMNRGNYAKTVADNIVIPTVADNIAKSGGPITVSVHTFNHDHTKEIEFEEVADAETLRPKLPTVADGSTRYYETLTEVLNGIPDGKYDLVSIQVFTDGKNNVTSTLGAEATMNEKIQEGRDKGWLFTFVGVDIDPQACTTAANEQECSRVRRTAGDADDYGATRVITATRIDSLRANTA